MADIKIAVINESTEITDAQVSTAVQALQIQVIRDYAPVWRVSADLRVASRGTAAVGEWWIVILDDADQAGALGYHDLTSEGCHWAKYSFAPPDWLAARGQ